jgi:hypothetical protein
MGSEDGAYLEYEMDGGPHRRLGSDHAEVEVAGDGAHTIAFRARDAAGNLSADRTLTVRVGTPEDRPPTHVAGFSSRATNPATTFTAARSFAGACPTSASLAPARDTYVDAEQPSVTHAAADALTVRSAAHGDARALLAFELPAADACEMTSARLSVYSANATPGRTVAAFRLASAWDDATTWLTRPGATGEPATAPAAAGWIDFDVTGQIRDMYRFGDSGLMLRDLAEGETSRSEQRFASAEDAGGHRPRLELSFR